MTSWKQTENKLTKEFIFENFSLALVFVNKVGKLAQRHDHHPDIHLVSYKKVILELTSHDAGNKVTKRDFDMAERIDKLVQ